MKDVTCVIRLFVDECELWLCDYDRGHLYPSERFGHGRCDDCLQCNARVMLAVIMMMYPSDKHGRGGCARWMLAASVIISCSIYYPTSCLLLLTCALNKTDC